MIMLRKIIRSLFMYSLAGRFRWYRKLHGGRWELWFIEICNAYVWLRIEEGLPDDRHQPCSIGPREAREDYL